MDTIKKYANGKEYLIKVAKQEERHLSGSRLGRHVEHDPRSRNYAIKTPAKLRLKTVIHNLVSPVLDQGSVGSCTGHAIIACLSAKTYLDRIPTQNSFRPSTSPSKNQNLALEFYKKATLIDEFYGAYPPDDTGSTGLAVAKIAKKLNLISAYKHAFSFDAALAALQAAPIIVGVNWYDGFDTPNSEGFVKVSGRPRGGHEFCIYGMDPNKGVVYARNSWGTSWGLKGNFNFSFRDLKRLLAEYGDATSFVALPKK